MSTTSSRPPAAEQKIEQVLVDTILPHPKNVRRHAVADEEMVASVRNQGIHQPLVAAPNPTLDDELTLIMGHRRLDAARKAGMDRVPVIVRTDLDTEERQLAAMLQENLHREALSPMEEAEGIQGLLDLPGFDVKRVAAETGLSQRRVRERAKLARLAPAAQGRLDGGHLTLERALALADFTGEPEEEDLLEVLDVHPSNWEWHLKRAKERREWRTRRPKVVAEHEAAGVDVIEEPDRPLWSRDQPWKEASFESVEEAKAAGASVIVREHHADVVYVVPSEVEERSAEDEAREARRALLEGLNQELDGVPSVEDEWIRSTVLPAVKAGDERTLRVLARYHHLATYVAGGRNEFPAMARVLALGDDIGTAPEAVGGALEGRPLAEQAALWTLCRIRPFYLGAHCYERPRGLDLAWFELRHALGWEWTDPEVRAIRELGVEDPLAPAPGDAEEQAAADGGEL